MERFYGQSEGWLQLQDLANKAFNCGFCSTNVSSVKGYALSLQAAANRGIYICPNCGGPIFFDRKDQQYPSAPFGQPVKHVPPDLGSLYEEARRSTSQRAFTGAVLLCRKMLMNIAVQEKAQAGLPFIQYVEYLANNGYVPPNGKHWGDHIRKKGNEATHEIALMSEADAKELMGFVEMLLRFIYEFPQLIPEPAP